MADTKQNTKQKNYIFAYEYLKNKIINGEYDEDYVFLETEISEELGISRTPVREALAMLKMEHLLINVPRKGVVCRKLTLEDIVDVYEVAEGIEGMMAYSVAKNGDREVIEKLKTAIEAMEEALISKDEEAWAAADEAFHMTLRDGCGNRFAQDSMDNIRLYIQMIRSRYTKPHTPFRERSTVQHREAYEAVLSGDADYARILVQHHWETVCRQFYPS